MKKKICLLILALSLVLLMTYSILITIEANEVLNMYNDGAEWSGLCLFRNLHVENLNEHTVRVYSLHSEPYEKIVGQWRLKVIKLSNFGNNKYDAFNKDLIQGNNESLTRYASHLALHKKNDLAREIITLLTNDTERLQNPRFKNYIPKLESYLSGDETYKVDIIHMAKEYSMFDGPKETGIALD